MTMNLDRRQILASLGTTLAYSRLRPFLHGREPDARPDRGASRGVADPFLAAVVAGDVERVRALLADDPSLAGRCDGRRRSAFVLAFVHGHPEVAAVIQATGIELDVVEAALAADWDRFAACAAADPECVTRAHPIGGTPLHAAALAGGTALWRLRNAGCKPDAVPAGGNGFTAARMAMAAARPHWARMALADLCSNGADVNAAQREGSSVLHGAVAQRDLRLLRLAIRKGADVVATDSEGRTPAQLAAAGGWQAGAELLRNHESLPRDNRASRFALDARREPVDFADLQDVPQELQSQVTGSSHFRFAAVKQFLKRDPRLTFSISTDDELAIEAAAHIGSRDIIRLHLDHGAPLSLPTAVSLGDFEAVKFWLDRDPTLVHERGAHDFPPMFFTVFGKGAIEMAKLLLTLGATVDQDSVGVTALHWCVKRRAYDLAVFLLENEADPEPVGYLWNRDGETPLQVARTVGDAKMVGVLERAGARR
ncbi:MAG: hypothetical protein NXI31_15965 [bacterium]|nr:hypothetical protein [bacterium]